jgi:DNA-binding CsgD family transcriptional regulator
VLERSPARLASATAKLDLGTALLGRRRAGEAVDHLQDAATTAAACGALRVAAKARDELERAGVTPRSDQGDSPLTAGERRVVALAVEGNTNRQIAELLFVSVKAVEWHLRNAYAKLGVANRGELATRTASGEVPGIQVLGAN